MHNAVAINLAFYTVHLVFEKESSINPFRRNHGIEKSDCKVICTFSIVQQSAPLVPIMLMGKYVCYSSLKYVIDIYKHCIESVDLFG